LATIAATERADVCSHTLEVQSRRPLKVDAPEPNEGIPATMRKLRMQTDPAPQGPVDFSAGLRYVAGAVSFAR